MNDILTIYHDDFTLRVDCMRFDQVRSKAESNIAKESLRCNYSWDEGVNRVEYRGKTMETDQWDAIFFDNTDYPIWVDFEGSDVSEAYVMANRQREYENFSYHEEKHVLSGFLNYGNEIGKTSLELRYVKGGVRKRWSLRYEVLSRKLDYHKHWKTIVEDIEREYRMLSLDFLKKTYHGLSVSNEGEQSDLIWWNIFKQKQQDLVRNVKLIIEKPKQRLRDKMVYRRADQLKKVTPRIEREFAEHHNQVEYAYKVEVPQLNRDTLENRFLKFVVGCVADRHEALAHRVMGYDVVSDPLRSEIEESCKQLKVLKQHPFFRGIGAFKGLTQESLTLQKATGYSKVYQIWLLLNKAYDLNDGLLKLETKDIATLYEIWCFIEVKNIVEELLHQNQDDVTVDNRSRIEMNKLFSYELDRGERSRIVFKQGDVELAELIYNPQEDTKDNKQTGIKDVVSRTVPQRPDIVLQLTKRDSVTGMKLTYLFDAKYRLGEKSKGVDTPPEDAINQMHRYRDALFYNMHPDYVGTLSPTDLKREVVGGYILFPGDGKRNEILLQNFYKAIKEVNIGAFPLRPNEDANRELLSDFIAELINSKTGELIGAENTIPQKGLAYELIGDDLILVAKVKNKDHLDWVVRNKWYNIPLDKMSSLPIMKARYLLLHANDRSLEPVVCKVVKSNCDVWTKRVLTGKGYPGQPSHEAYFMLRIHSPNNTEEHLQHLSYKFNGAKEKSPFYMLKLSELTESLSSNKE